MNDNGFTMVELIITIAVLGIISATIFPMMDLDFGYLDKMTNEFVSDVRYVQMRNMEKPGSGYVIQIHMDSGKYYVRHNLDIEKKVLFKSRYVISFNNGNSISFTYDGVPMNAGTLTITDTKTKRNRKITIVPATGRTIILE